MNRRVRTNATTPPRYLGTPDEYKQSVVAQFNKRAAVYDGTTGGGPHQKGAAKPNTYHPPMAAQTVRLACLQLGDVCVDVACGTGMVALEACRACFPEGKESPRNGGRVTGLDISQGMLDVACSKRDALGYTQQQCTFLCADVDTVDFAPASLDAVLCSNALIYMVDMRHSLQEWSRWLRPGGRLVFNTPQQPFTKTLAVFLDVLQEFGIPLNDPACGLPTAAEAQSALQSAGFADVRVEVEEGISRPGPTDRAAFVDSCWSSLLQVAFFARLPERVDAQMLGSIKARYYEAMGDWYDAERERDGSISDTPHMMWAVAVK